MDVPAAAEVPPWLPQLAMTPLPPPAPAPLPLLEPPYPPGQMVPPYSSNMTGLVIAVLAVAVAAGLSLWPWLTQRSQMLSLHGAHSPPHASHSTELDRYIIDFFLLEGPTVDRVAVDDLCHCHIDTHPCQLWYQSTISGAVIINQMLFGGAERASEQDSSNSTVPVSRLRERADGTKEIGNLTISPTVLGYGSSTHGTIVFGGDFGGRPVAVKRLLVQFHDVALKEVDALIASDEHPNVLRCGLLCQFVLGGLCAVCTRIVTFKCFFFT